MSKKKKNESKHSNKNNKNVRSFDKRRILVSTAIGVSLVVVVVLGILFGKSLVYGKYLKSITKDEAREAILGYKPEIANPKVLANPLWIADSFAVEDLIKEGSKIGEEAIIVMDNPSASKYKKIPKQASLLLIVDNNLKILGLRPFNPSYFDITIDSNKFFDDFKGKDPLSIIKQVDGIYTGSSNTATIIKNKVREAMSLFYIEKYGEGEFNSIAGNSFISADKGTTVEAIQAIDINGNTVDLSKFKNYKLFILGGNPGCGGCVESVKRLGLEIAKYDTSSVKFIVLSFSPEKADLEKLTQPLPQGAIGILDPDRKLAEALKVSSSPYIALVDKDLTLFYRGPGEPMKETLDNIKAFFEGK